MISPSIPLSLPFKEISNISADTIFAAKKHYISAQLLFCMNENLINQQRGKRFCTRKVTHCTVEIDVR